jgi:hypothetical protein
MKEFATFYSLLHVFVREKEALAPEDASEFFNGYSC